MEGQDFGGWEVGRLRNQKVDNGSGLKGEVVPGGGGVEDGGGAGGEKEGGEWKYHLWEE